MFASSNATAYAQMGVESGVQAATPHKLILMLFDGAMLALASASHNMAQKNIPEKGSDISRAINIISNGLRASLDVKAGGLLAERLYALYEYMCNRLLFANLHNDQEVLNEVSRLLGDLRSAWAEIADDPAVVSANRAVA